MDDLPIRQRELELSLRASKAYTHACLLTLVAAAATLLLYVPLPLCLAWCATNVLYLLWRRTLVKRYWRLDPQTKERQLERWTWIFTVSIFFYGALWAVAAVLAFPYSPLAMQLCWTFVIVTMFSLSTPLNSLPQTYAQLGSSAPALALAWWLWGDCDIALPMIAAVVACAATYILIAYQQRLGRRERIRLELRNEELTRTLAQRNTVLDATNQSKTALLAAASHDLRQPVHALGMIVDLMDAADGAALRRRIASARTCVESLSCMLTQMLDYNRLELGLYDINRQVVDLDPLLREAAESFTAAAEHKGLFLRLDCLPMRVVTDPSLLRRMLFNLLANAIRYSACGGIELKCCIHNGAARITVQDTGIGIAADRLGDIFLEYVRLPGERGDREEGLGLGLSIVSKGAALLGCKVSVESTPGKGSCFTLDLGPALRVESPVEPPPAPATMPPVTIAVIEDDPVVLEGLVDTLKAWGCEPVGARELGQLQLQLGRREVRPALLLCDLHLSHALTGLDAIERLRKEHSTALPAILLTGDLDPKLEQQARAAAVQLIHKPVRPALLREAVLAALNSSREAQVLREPVRQVA